MITIIITIVTTTTTTTTCRRCCHLQWFQSQLCTQLIGFTNGQFQTTTVVVVVVVVVGILTFLRTSSGGGYGSGGGYYRIRGGRTAQRGQSQLLTQGIRFFHGEGNHRRSSSIATTHDDL